MAIGGGLNLNDERLVSCTSKVRHETAAKAHSVMKRSPYVKKLNVYHCKYCGKFHIGSRKG